ncbi:MAG: glycosyltransferase family 4 protein [Eggerthellaceae bacterium]|nr:glycosyltransferase family 4 protein [Eggerthellaceae bacterium]
MRIIFASVAAIENIASPGIYTDLLRTFRDHGHEVTVIAPREKRTGLPTELEEQHGITVLHVATGNIQKCSAIEKGMSLLALKRQYSDALRNHMPNKKFDLVLYATPPTTIAGLIESLKTQTGAKSYLLLKDIFPQNALDIGMLSDHGAKSIMYRYFKKTEHRTYEVADWIGCMSPANREYLLSHEPWLNAERVEVNPNSVIPLDLQNVDRIAIRKQYGIPGDERVFAYGGNLGKPQGVGFLIDALRCNEQMPAGFFLIAGSGTERHLLEAFFEAEQPAHARLLPSLPRDEFDSLLYACDAGIVLLDHRFTIPNYPSRALSYMQASLPVLCATDPVSDMGKVAEENGFGIDCRSNDPKLFVERCRSLSNDDLHAMGARAKAYMMENYTAEKTYETIMRHFDD